MGGHRPEPAGIGEGDAEGRVAAHRDPEQGPAGAAGHHAVTALDLGHDVAGDEVLVAPSGPFTKNELPPSTTTTRKS